LNASEKAEKVSFVVDAYAFGAIDARVERVLENRSLERIEKGKEQRGEFLVRFEDALAIREVSLYRIDLTF